MKLARPNIRHPRIVFAGCQALIDGEGDDAGLVAALRDRGLPARWLAWDDPETLHADLVILRVIRDRTERHDEFLAWTSRVRNLLNAPAVVAWNSDKRYLADLAAAGVPTAPSGCRAPGDRVEAHQEAGETALVFLGGTRSHAFAKGSMVPAADPDFELWDLGHAALAAAAEKLGIGVEEFLYARVDVLGDRTDPRLLELELIEPSLGWGQLTDADRALAQRRFALAVESALERLDLGPLSHRRP